MGPTFPQCHLNSRQTNHKYGIGPHEQYGRHAGNGCRQYAPCIISEHPGCVHLGQRIPVQALQDGISLRQTQYR